MSSVDEQFEAEMAKMEALEAKYVKYMADKIGVSPSKGLWHAAMPKAPPVKLPPVPQSRGTIDNTIVTRPIANLGDVTGNLLIAYEGPVRVYYGTPQDQVVDGMIHLEFDPDQNIISTWQEPTLPDWNDLSVEEREAPCWVKADQLECPNCGTMGIQATPKHLYTNAPKFWSCCYKYCTVNAKRHIIPRATACEYCGKCEEHCACVLVECGHKWSPLVEVELCSECKLCHGCCKHFLCQSCNVWHSKRDKCDCGSWGYCEDHCANCNEEHEEYCGCSECSREVGPTPWSERGVTIDKVKLPLDLDQWKGINPAQAMADFYLLSFMSFPGLGTGPDYLVEEYRAFETLCKLANEERDRLVAELDPKFRMYIDVAVGGEVRHHRSVKREKIMSRDRNIAWRHWLHVREVLGVDALSDAASLFRDGSMPDGFGGEPWAVAADVLHMRETGKIQPWLFVDRVFTLEHNNGSILNKVRWGRDDRYSGQQDALVLCKYVGNAHASDPPDLALLLFVASGSTRSLFNTWWLQRNRVLRAMGRKLELKPTWQDRIGLAASWTGNKNPIFLHKNGKSPLFWLDSTKITVNKKTAKKVNL